MTSPRDELGATPRAYLGEIPAQEAENDGWPQRAMPAMLGALGLTEAPKFGWFVNAIRSLTGPCRKVGATAMSRTIWPGRRAA